MSKKRVTKKSKKTIMTICVIAILLGGLVIGGFFLFRAVSPRYIHKINNVSQLCAMESGKSYALNCDIDLNGAVWESKSVYNFNGNGHTIKNANITSMAAHKIYSGFFATANKISNLNFENIRVVIPSASDGSNYIGIVCGTSSTIENVHIKNSVLRVNTSAQCTYKIGGISGEGAKFINCSVENCNLRLTGQHKHKDYWSHFGGIVGFSESDTEITDCKVTDSEMFYSTQTNSNIGLFAGEIKDKAVLNRLVAYNNSIQLDSSATNYPARVGGLIGNMDAAAGNLQNSASISNEITCTANDRFCVGGLIGRNSGTIKNCISDLNVINGITKNTEDTAIAYTAGFCAVNYGTITRSIAQNCAVNGSESDSNMEAGPTAGFCALGSGAISYCSAWQITLAGKNKYNFVASAENLFHCLENPDNKQWNEVLTVLDLDGELWKFDKKLILKIAEEI